MKKLCHLHLLGNMGGKSTLICYLKDGSIKYNFYGGWGSSGTPYALSNLQCQLPIDLESEDESMDHFVKRVIRTVNLGAVGEKVVNQINCNVTFKS